MNEYKYYMPVKLFFGKNSLENLSDFITYFKKALIVTGKNSAKLSGALDDVINLLEKNGKDYFLYDKVEENPSLQTVDKGVDVFKESGADFVIAIGGGSPIDAAKVIALCSSNNIKAKKLYDKTYKPNNIANVIFAIPTTSGTGTEVTQYAVLTDRDSKNKAGISNDTIFPFASFLNPQYTYTMPETVIIDTGIDAFTHAYEGLISTKSNPHSDFIALESIKLIYENLKKASQKDKDAMDKMQYAAMLAGIVIAQTGTILLHALGYPLTVNYGISHGRANALMLNSFDKYIRKKLSDQRLKVLNEVYKMKTVEDFLDELGLKTGLSNYGVEREKINEMSENVMNKRNLLITPGKTSLEDVIELYKESF